MSSPITSNCQYSNHSTREKLLAALDKLDDHLAASDLKSGTLRVYRSRLRGLHSFIQQQNILPGTGTMSSVVSAYLEEYIAATNPKPVTIRNIVCTFKFLLSINDIQINVDAFHTDHVRPRVLSPLTPPEQTALLGTATASLTRRDLLIVLLFMTTGIRPRELVNIRLSDLVTSETLNSIRVRRGTYIKLEPISDPLRQALKDWLIERNQDYCSKTSPYLIFNAHGNPLATVSLDFALRKVGWRAGLHISARRLRDTYLLQSREQVEQLVPPTCAPALEQFSP